MDSLTINLSPCNDETLAARKALNQRLEVATNSQIQWHQCSSPQEYRNMRRDGTNGFPKAPTLDSAETLSISSSHGAPQILLRVIKPKGESKGVMLHYHAGGLVYGSAGGQDNYLSDFANDLSITVASVEYRLAPENPFPASGEDAMDALRFALSKRGEEKLGGKLLFVAGESSGAYLATWSLLKLRDEGVELKGRIAGLVLSYGIYDLSFTPSVNNDKGRVLVGKEDLRLLVNAAFPLATDSVHKRRDPSMSPLYAGLKGLPKAFFLVGTADPVLDDSVFMASRWFLAGNEAHLKIIPEACHAFTVLPMGDAGVEGRAEIKAFMRSVIP